MFSLFYFYFFSPPLGRRADGSLSFGVESLREPGGGGRSGQYHVLYARVCVRVCVLDTRRGKGCVDLSYFVDSNCSHSPLVPSEHAFVSSQDDL